MIEVQNLSKSFRHNAKWFGRKSSVKPSIQAVKDMTFTIRQGEFVGFLGPNGAGKSTTIKMMTGILHPTSGHVTALGLSPVTQRVALARQIGVVFGQRTQLWWDLPLFQSFEILRAMYRIPKDEFRHRLSELVDLLNLSPFLERPVRQLSLGERMRGELAGALLHNPKVLFLDEPTIGLDVTAKNAVRKFLRHLNDEYGVTIILTTHDMSDVEELCERIVVINHGEKVFDGSKEQLEMVVGAPSVITVTYRDKPQLQSRLGDATSTLQVTQGTLPEQISVFFNRRQESAASVLERLQSYGELVDFSLEEPSLESIIEVMYAERKK